MSEDPREILRRHLRPGMRVAVADGAGMPLSLLEPLAEVAAEVGDISLLLGWCLEQPFAAEPTMFADVRTIMGGFGLGPWIQAGLVGYVPCRLRAVPALVEGPLRPDVLLMAVRPSDRGGEWGTEVSWMAAAAERAPLVIVEENDALPATTVLPPLAPDRSVVGSRVSRSPLEFTTPAPTEATRAIAEHLLGWIPEGVRLQYGPGPVADALIELLDRPVHVHSGMLTDGVMTLAERGLLLSTPLTTYVTGSPDFYRWADGRGLTDRLESTHRLSSGPPLVAINAALEIDETGQVNVQGSADRPVSGMGGHPDFSMMGAISEGGLSIMALPSRRGTRSSLVEELSGPVSTPRIDVDVVVTDRGSADLRGRTDAERRVLLRDLWSS